MKGVHLFFHSESELCDQKTRLNLKNGFEGTSIDCLICFSTMTLRFTCQTEVEVLADKMSHIRIPHLNSVQVRCTSLISLP